jgi:predicted kinase
MLIVFSGLPGVGKTVIARELARQISAVYLRIDSIEQALRHASSTFEPLNDAGYCVAYAIAEDNLRLGRTVVADSVNPISITRDAWLDVAKRTGLPAAEIEIQCSDPNEHRRRIEARLPDIPGLRLPTWQEVISREYQPWNRQHIVVDTSASSVEQNVNRIREVLSSTG